MSSVKPPNSEFMLLCLASLCYGVAVIDKANVDTSLVSPINYLIIIKIMRLKSISMKL